MSKGSFPSSSQQETHTDIWAGAMKTNEKCVNGNPISINMYQARAFGIGIKVTIYLIKFLYYPFGTLNNYF